MKRSSNIELNTDRYLAVVGWARKRYTDATGLLVLSKGSQLSVYSRIEQAAWRKYKAWSQHRLAMVPVIAKEATTMHNTTSHNADDALLAKLGIHTFATASGVPMSAVVQGIGDAATVAFYDVRYPHTAYGQFITEYYVSTLLESAQGHADRGLALDGGIPAWDIDAGAYAGVIAFLRTIA